MFLDHSSLAIGEDDTRINPPASSRSVNRHGFAGSDVVRESVEEWPGTDASEE